MANEIEIVVTARDNTRGFASIDNSARGVGGRLKSRFADIGTVAGGVLVANITAQLASFASQGFGWVWDGARLFEDTQESMNKVDAVFGDSAAVIREFAKNADTNLGLSERAALDATGQFGNMFDQLGFTDTQAAGMSQTMAILAADFASFNNADITDVLQAQEAAFRGEFDAVQRFVPTINAAAVEQKALELTMKDSTKELTAADKAMAVHALLVEGAGKATGDFARTAEDAANKERILAAEAENLQAAIGEKLTPITRGITDLKLKLVRAITDLLPKLEEYGQMIGNVVGPALEFLSENSHLVWGALAGLGAVIAAVVIPAIAGLVGGIALAAAPFIAAGLAIGAVAAAVIWAYENVEPFREAVDRLRDKIVEVAEAALEFVRNIDWDELRAKAEPVIERVTEILTTLAEVVAEVIDTIIDIIEDIDWQALWADVEPILQGVGAAFEDVAAIVEDVITLIVDIIEDVDWEGLWADVEPILQDAGAAFEDLSTIIEEVLGWIKDDITEFVDFATEFWAEWGDEISAATQVAWDIITGIIETAVGVIAGVIEAFAALVTGDWEGLWDALVGITETQTASVEGIVSAGTDNIKSTMSSAWAAVRDDASAKWDAISGIVSAAIDFIKGLLSFSPSIDWSGLLGNLPGIVNSISTQVNRVIELINRIPSVNIPSLPTGGSASRSFSTGGSASRSFSSGGGSVNPGAGQLGFFPGGGSLPGHGIAAVADRGREIIDLPGGGSLLAIPGGGRVVSNPGTEERLGGGGGPVTVNVFVEGSVITGQQLDRHISAVVAEQVRRGGFDDLGGLI